MKGKPHTISVIKYWYNKTLNTLSFNFSFWKTISSFKHIVVYTDFDVVFRRFFCLFFTGRYYFCRLGILWLFFWILFPKYLLYCKLTSRRFFIQLRWVFIYDHIDLNSSFEQRASSEKRTGELGTACAAFNFFSTQHSNSTGCLFLSLLLLCFRF